MTDNLRPVHMIPSHPDYISLLPSLQEEALQAAGFIGLGLYERVLARAPHNLSCTRAYFARFPDPKAEVDVAINALIDAGLVVWVPVAEEGGAA